jgi:hypothetical protein
VVERLLEKLGPNGAQIRTNVPTWLFPPGLCQNGLIFEKAIDSGIAELDVYDQNVGLTVERCLRICDKADEIVREEVDELRDVDCQVVVGDIPYLIGPIARELTRIKGRKVTSIAVGNFSWDYIYALYSSTERMSDAITKIKDWYGTVDHIYHLPFGHHMTAFTHVIPTPVLCRKPKLTKADARKLLGLDFSAPVVLIALRLRDLESVNTAAETLLEKGCFVLTFDEKVQLTHPRFRVLGKEWSPRFVEVLRAADVIVSKLGYSIAAEAIAAGVALAYPPRRNYNEHELLQNGIKGVLLNREIPQNDFTDSNWWPYISELLSEQRIESHLDLTGDEMIAEGILKALAAGL